MRPATLAILGYALGAAGAHALKVPFPGRGQAAVPDLIAYHGPGVHNVIRVCTTRSTVAVFLAGARASGVAGGGASPRQPLGYTRGMLAPTP